MKFVGQLFRVSLLSDKIMHTCVQMLFGDPDEAEKDEEMIQCLCTLMQTIGRQLEDAAAKKKAHAEKPDGEHAKCMKNYLKSIAALSENGALSSRIRFMCKDLLEMRQNGWTARRVEEQAKTIAQIHRDAEREMGKSGKGGKGGGGGQTPRGGQTTPRGGGAQDVRSADGWETVRKPAPNHGSGARGPAAATSSDGVGAGGVKSGGGFSAFNDKGKRDKAEKAEKKAKAEAKAQKKAAKADKAVNIDAEAGAAAGKECAMTAEAFANAARAEVEQFLQSGDAKEALEAVAEMGAAPDGHVKLFTMGLLDQLFTKTMTKSKDAEMAPAAKLLVDLVAQGSIRSAGILDGLGKFCENLEDYAVDAPKAVAWLVAVLVGLVAGGLVRDLAFLGDAGGMLADGWALEDEFAGFATKFALKVCAAVAAGGGDAKALVTPLGLRAKAANDEAFDALLTAEGLAGIA